MEEQVSRTGAVFLTIPGGGAGFMGDEADEGQFCGGATAGGVWWSAAGVVAV